jgi:AraC-like DNA-binding protein
MGRQALGYDCSTRMTKHPGTINDFLRHLHLGAEVYYIGQLCDAWHMPMPGSDTTAFHLICHGEAWVHMPDSSAPTKLTAGDIAFFPNGAAHTFSGKRKIVYEPFDYSHPLPLDKNAAGTGIFCGRLKLPAHIRRLLLASFPEFMLVRPSRSQTGKQMHNLIKMMSKEAEQNDLGATAILDRLSDTLFFHIIRHALHLNPRLSPLLIALSDDNLRLATQAFIESPADPWTVDALAKKACLSRSAFAERFAGMTSMPPMEFVAIWRMQLASGMLAVGNANMLDVALRCGYESEAAFRKAFKRVIGIAPGKVRASGKLPS